MEEKKSTKPLLAELHVKLSHLHPEQKQQHLEEAIRLKKQLGLPSPQKQ